MSPLNSSTSSSEPTGRRGWSDALATLGWMIAALACIDVVVNFAFPPPSDPRVPPSSLQSYFEYGRSLEGKLDRLVGRTDDRTAPICFAGWLDPPPGDDQPKALAAGADHMVAFYGMSFTNHVGNALETLDPRFTVRRIAGPAAPPSFAYAAFEGDRGRHDADAVVLGVLDSSVVGLLSDNGLCRNFHGAAAVLLPQLSGDRRRACAARSADPLAGRPPRDLVRPRPPRRGRRRSSRLGRVLQSILLQQERPRRLLDRPADPPRPVSVAFRSGNGPLLLQGPLRRGLSDDSRCSG